MSDPEYDGVRASQGFHIIKDRWKPKSRLKDYCNALVANMDAAMEATKAAAPCRAESFQLARSVSGKIDKTERERRWERSVYERWSGPGLSPVSGCWDRLVAFQTPLFAEQSRNGWGYIDLLGIRGRTPVVVELKKEPTTNSRGGTDRSETPLRIVLEAVSYGIALRECWQQSFRGEFMQQLQNLGIPEETITAIPRKLASVQLVGAAPAAYWLDWLPVTKKGTSSLGAEAWEAFNQLLDELGEWRFPFSFVSISGDIDVPKSLAAQPLTRFPLIAH